MTRKIPSQLVKSSFVHVSSFVIIVSLELFLLDLEPICITNLYASGADVFKIKIHYGQNVQ